jgi:hypothetical protein
MISIPTNFIDGVNSPSRDLSQEEKATIIASYFLGSSYLHYQIGDEDLLSARMQAEEILTSDIISSESALENIGAMMQDHGDQYLEAYMNQYHSENNPFES